jgi:hypothetical protein
MIFAILSTLTILATLGTLTRSILDWRERSRLGVNGALRMLARQAMVVESLRICKHVLLAVSVWSTVLGTARPWLTAAACLTLGGTSILAMYFRHQVERKVAQDKRVAAMKTVPTLDRPKP